MSFHPLTQAEAAHKYNHEIDMMEERWIASHPLIKAAADKLAEAQFVEQSQTYMADAALFVVRLMGIQERVRDAQKDLNDAYSSARIAYRHMTGHLRRPK
jgi:hypothetical protein